MKILSSYEQFSPKKYCTPWVAEVDHKIGKPNFSKIDCFQDNLYQILKDKLNLTSRALDTLNISYEFIEFYDDTNELVCGFEFRIEYIQVECPTLHKTRKELDLSNLMHKNSKKLIANHKKTL